MGCDKISVPSDTQNHRDGPAASRGNNSISSPKSTRDRDRPFKANAARSGLKVVAGPTDRSSEVMVAEATPEDFDRLLLSWTLMGYHIPQRYLGALLAACAVATVRHPDPDPDPASPYLAPPRRPPVILPSAWNQRFSHIHCSADL